MLERKVERRLNTHGQPEVDASTAKANAERDRSKRRAR
jgi:hypothetical protein